MPKKITLQNIINDFNNLYSATSGEGKLTPNYLHLVRRIYREHKNNLGESIIPDLRDVAYSLLQAVKQTVGNQYVKSAKLTLENNFSELSGKL